MEPPITAEFLLSAYAGGYFPMAQDRRDPRLYWFHPERRGVLPLETFHVPSRLQRLIARAPFTLTVNRAFPEVIRGCADRTETWINDAIIALYCELHAKGHAHSVECWQDSRLAGGIYGVALGGAFFGESMFARAPNASKVALVHLAHRLREGGYSLFDTQYVNDHLKQFGVEEITRAEYLARLQAALERKPQNIWEK